MYLMYIDESGDTISLSQGGKKFLILTGCIVAEKNKISIWVQYPAQNPYEIAYIFLIERFQKYLKEKDALGICIIDPREGQVEKAFIGDELDRIHNLLRWKEHGFWQKCPNIVERLLFATSDKTVGIQLADLYCYPVLMFLSITRKRVNIGGLVS